MSNPPTIEEMEGALLDWMDQSGGSMRNALDQFGITDQSMRNTILARNIERKTGLSKGAAFESAQAAQQSSAGQSPGHQPMMSPQEFGSHALTEARQEARAMPGGDVAQNLPSVAPAPSVQRAAMQQEAEASGLPPEQAEQLAYAERPDLAPPPVEPAAPVRGRFITPQTMQVQASRSGIPGGGGGRIGGYIREYEGLSDEMRGAIGRGAEAMGGALEKQEEALRREKNLAQQQATQEAMLGRERMQQYEQLQLEQADREKQRQQRVETDMQNLRDSLQKIQESEIDPARFYKKPDGTRDYGKSLLAGVAVALGALGEQLQGRSGNPALDIIERSIERDIAAQRENLASRRAGYGLEVNLLGQMRQQFADERQAETAARIAMLDAYEMKLGQVAASTKSEAIQRRYEKSMADLSVKKAELLSSFEQDSIRQAMAETQAAFGMEATRQQLGMQRQAMSAKMGAGGRGAPALSGFVPFRAVGKDEQKEARKTMDTAGEAVSAMDQLIALREKVGSETWPAYVNENKAKLETRGHDLLMQMKELYNMGALQEHEMEMMERMLPDPASWGNVLPQITTLRDMALERLEGRMERRGYTRGTPRTLPGERVEPR